jgi:RNA polymerase sigma-70 factor (ECF subfamily)
MGEPEIPDRLRDGARAAWPRYLDAVAPFRPDLHRYCRSLTGNLWDAEDLVQDSLLRGFAALGSSHQPIRSLRGYLVRIATNLWLDSVRRGAVERRVLHEQRESLTPGPAPAASVSSEAHAAAETLLHRLPPQERAAVVLKDVLDMSLEDIAQALQTTVGAIKAALHRGRETLRARETDKIAARPRPSRQLVEKFVALVNASDLPGMLELMLDTATIETLGSLVEVGREQFSQKGSWLWQSVYVHPDLPPEIRPKKCENELALYQGEPVMLSFSDQTGERNLVSIARFEEIEGRVSRIRAYYLCPETMREVAETLQLPIGSVPHRLPDFMKREK